MLHSQAQLVQAVRRPKKALSVKSSTKSGNKKSSSPSKKPTLKKISRKRTSTTAKFVVKSTTGKVLQIAKPKATIKSSSTEEMILIQKLNRILDGFAPLLAEKEGNISKNNHAEEKYDYLTQYGTQILALFTPSSGCTYLSRNFERITGQKAPSQLGDKFYSLLPAEAKEKLHNLLCPISPSAVQEAKEQMVRLKMQHADGKYYWYQFTIHTQAQQYVCLIENIHEHIQVQNTLQKAKLESELALRARSEFLANMSHELRTPLNAVIGFSQIMENGIFGEIENPHYAGYVRNIQESGHDLLAKIEDLLEISNIDAGRTSLEREEIYINDLVKHVLRTQSYHAKSAKVLLSYIPKGNVLLFVDRLKMQHILGHLITNAIKFNNAGGEVTVEVGRYSKNGIKLSVHDNGVGMNELKCHDIRESLQQESCWTAKNSQHIGIGLALTKEFVELHGGAVEINSSAGIGTTVSIILPRDCMRLLPNRKIEHTNQLEYN